MEDQLKFAAVFQGTVTGPSELFALMSAVGGGELTFTVTASELEPPGPVQVSVYTREAGPASGPRLSEPDEDFVPDQAPDAVHDVMTPDDVHESDAVLLCATETGPSDEFAFISTVGAGGGFTVTTTASLALPPGPVQLTV